MWLVVEDKQLRPTIGRFPAMIDEPSNTARRDGGIDAQLLVPLKVVHITAGSILLVLFFTTLIFIYETVN